MDHVVSNDDSCAMAGAVIMDREEEEDDSAEGADDDGTGDFAAGGFCDLAALAGIGGGATGDAGPVSKRGGDEAGWEVPNGTNGRDKSDDMNFAGRMLLDSVFLLNRDKTKLMQQRPKKDALYRLLLSLSFRLCSTTATPTPTASSHSDSGIPCTGEQHPFLPFHSDHRLSIRGFWGGFFRIRGKRRGKQDFRSGRVAVRGQEFRFFHNASKPGIERRKDAFAT